MEIYVTYEIAIVCDISYYCIIIQVPCLFVGVKRCGQALGCGMRYMNKHAFIRSFIYLIHLVI